MESKTIYNLEAKLFNSKTIDKYSLTFGDNLMSFRNENVEMQLYYNDIIGATKIANKDKLGYENLKSLIYLNACPKIPMINTSCCGKETSTFKREIIQIAIFAENEDETQLFNIFNNIALSNKPKLQEPIKKRLLVFVNPTSGRGKCMEKWLEAERVFNLSHVEVQLMKTKYHKHAYDYVLSLEKSVFDGIICVSGDGIVHEVINALMHRKDNLKEEIVVGTIPAGTGNGLSKTLSELNHENYDCISFAYMICKGHTDKLDLFELETNSQSNRIFAFHSVSTGHVAEIGIMSEFMRCLGDVRYKLYAFWRLITLNSRRFYTSMFYPEKEENDERSIDEFPDLSKELPENIFNFKDEIRFMYIMNLKWMTEIINAPDPTKYDDGLMDIVVK